jgi:hypothetical protein
MPRPQVGMARIRMLLRKSHNDRRRLKKLRYVVAEIFQVSLIKKAIHGHN